MLAALAVHLVLVSQSSGTEVPVLREGERVEVRIAAEDEPLDGHGRSRALPYTVSSPGMLRVWATSGELDPFLRLEDGAGRALVEDDDSGGGQAASLDLEVESGDRLLVRIASSRPDGEGRATVCLTESPETEATRAAAERALEELAQVTRLRNSQEVDEARRRLSEAIEELLAVEGGRESTRIAESCRALGFEAHALGALRSAREVWTLWREYGERTLPGEHPELQRARQHLAIALKSLGDLEGARALEQQVLEVRSRLLPDDHPELQQARNNLANTIGALGDLEGARALAENVLAVRSRTLPEEHRDLQRARQNLAGRLHQLGDLPGARVLQEQVLEVYSRTLPHDHPDLQMARLNLSGTLFRLGDVAGACSLQEQALEAYSETLPDDHPDLQNARQHLAASLHVLGDLEGARELLRAVVESLAGVLPEQHHQVQAARHDLAVALYATGDLAGAQELLEHVLDVRSRTLPDEHHDLQLARADLAYALATRVRREAGAKEGRAEARYRERFGALSRDFDRGSRRACELAVLESSAREAEERAASKGTLDAALSLARGYGVFPRDPALDEEAFLLCESTRNVALVSAGLARSARAEPGWAGLRARITQATERLAGLAQQPGTGAELEAARAELELAQRELVRLGSALDPAGLRALQADAAAFSSALGDEDALLAYRSYTLAECGEDGRWSNTDRWCAFVVRRSGLTRVELGPLEPIVAAVEEWRAALGAGAPDASRGIGAGAADQAQSEEARAGCRLRELVFDPLAGPLSGARRIVLALDDALHLVPFDALPCGDGESAPLLGDALRIETRGSLLELLQPRAPPGGGGLIVIGDVDYGSSDGKSAELPQVGARGPELAGVLRGSAFEAGFATLPATAEEARGIAALLQESPTEAEWAVLLTGERASTRELAALAGGARWLHVATHGWFAPDPAPSTADPVPEGNAVLRMSIGERVRGMNPMLLAGLALSGANLPQNELGRIPGLVTAEEIGVLDLSRCELAVLSACDTSVGVRRAGQGVASLQKALHMAGARSAITSLWKVPDETTKELMLDFYRRLWLEKRPKWRALWEAKTRLRRARDGQGRPLHATRDWAGWVLSGDPD